MPIWKNSCVFLNAGAAEIAVSIIKNNKKWSDRNQIVYFIGTLSGSTGKMQHGVPQGSILRHLAPYSSQGTF